MFQNIKQATKFVDPFFPSCLVVFSPPISQSANSINKLKKVSQQLLNVSENYQIPFDLDDFGAL